MKLTAFLALTTIAFTAFFSCKKKVTEEPVVPYACASCARTPEALAANDNIAKGIYKGTIVASSGTIKFDLANNGNTLTAVMVIDGVTVNLAASVTYTAGQPVIAPFTGMLNGQAVTINFSVAANGSTPTVTSSNIPGHPNATITVYKETSSNLIEAFEGTYSKPSASGTETGIFNTLMSDGLGAYSAVGKRNGSTSAPGVSSGTYINHTLTSSPGQGGTVSGTVSADNISGTIVDQYGTGTFTGHRTL